MTPGPTAVPGQPTFRLSDVLAARHRIAGTVRRTPLAYSPWLSEAARARVYLKLESLQLTNSFKIRGALNAVRALVDRDPAPRLVTASAGNHGRALAYAAEQLGLPLTVFVARTAPITKLDAIRRHGADLRAVADHYDQTEPLAKAFAAAEGATFISAYSHPDIVAGAGTIALEIVEDLPDVDRVVVPVGGGGLVGGIAATLHSIAGGRIRVVGVETDASPVFHTSLQAGRLVRIDVRDTIADGLAGNADPETITFDLISRFVERIVLASDARLREGIRGLVREEHLIAEGAGIAALAALVAGTIDVRGQNVVVVVSGSNIDADRLSAILAER